MTMPAFDEHDHSQVGKPSGKHFIPGDAQLDLVEIIHSGKGVAEMLQSFADTVATSLGLDFAEVLEHRPDRRSFALLSSGGPVRIPRGCADVSQELASQAGYTLLRRRPVVVTDSAEEDRFDQWRGLAAAGLESGVTVPIVLGDEILGVLGAYSRRSRDYTDAEVSFLVKASRYLAAGLSRSKEEQRRGEAEQRLRIVEEATRRAAAAPNEDTTLQSFSQLFSSPSEDLSDVCFIDLELDAGKGLHRAAAARDGVRIPIADSQRRPFVYPPYLESSDGTQEAVLDSEKANIVGNVERENLRAIARDEAHLRTLEEVSPVSYMCVPIKARRQILGALVLVSGKHRYSQKDTDHARTLARLVGLTVDNIRTRLHDPGRTRGEIGHYLPTPDLTRPSGPDGDATPRAADSEDRAEPLFMSHRRRIAFDYLLQDIEVLEIASLMNTTKSNIYKHQKELFKRFGVRSRAALREAARRYGYGPPC